MFGFMFLYNVLMIRVSGISIGSLVSIEIIKDFIYMLFGSIFLF
jgi:hypothetical protein